MPTVEHFEIPVNDIEKAKHFYHSLFGWEIHNAEMEGIEYWLVKTTQPNGEKGISGGMVQRQSPEHCNLNYVGVSSVDEYVAKAEQLGGQVIVPKRHIPGQGFFAICMDTEGNPFGVWESEQ